jgi:ribosomal protein L1
MRPPGAKGVYWRTAYIASTMRPSEMVDHGAVQAIELV